MDVCLLLDSAHEFVPAEPAVGTHDHDDFLSEALSDGLEYFFQSFPSARASIPVGLAQFGPERDGAAKTVKRQVAVVFIVAVVKAPLLLAVNRVVGCIKVQKNHPALTRDGLHAALHKQVLDLFGVGLDLPVVAVFAFRAEFKPVERALAGQGVWSGGREGG